MVDLMSIKETYLGVKLHFTDTYDYIKYGGKTNVKLDTFTKRKDRYFFHKLSKRFNERDVLDFLLVILLLWRQVGWWHLITNEKY